MTKPVIRLQQATKMIQNGAQSSRTILDAVDFSIQPGDFITVLGGNGAGKSTLFNTISGTLPLTSGQVFLQEKDITHEKEEKRARAIGRVFQDPKMGTAPRMTVAENLLLALHRGERRGFKRTLLKKYREEFFAKAEELGNGLEQHLDTPTGHLSGGQRQALSLLMATMKQPEVLLLDEHTAALDPKAARQLMERTNQQVTEQEIPCLMITHRMEDALKYGNRLVVMKKGQIYLDFDQPAKQALTLEELYRLFEDSQD